MDSTLKIRKTILNSRLLSPDSYTVECGSKKARFNATDKLKVGEWIMSIWKSGEIEPAYVYYNIDWDSDHVLYAKYELEAESIFDLLLN